MKYLLAVLLCFGLCGEARATCANNSTSDGNRVSLAWGWNQAILAYAPISENSDCTIGGSGGGGGGGAVTAATGSYADGALVTEGSKADAAYAGSGSASEIAIEKGIYALLGGTQTVSVSNFPATQAISAASLPLPAGAATAAAQPALNGDGGALAHVTNFPATQPVSGTVALTAPAAGAWAGSDGYAQGSTTAGQYGPVMQGEVYSGNPNYTSGTTNPLAMTPSGGLKATIYAVNSAVGATIANGSVAGGLQPALTFNTAPSQVASGAGQAAQSDSFGSQHVTTVASPDAFVGITPTTVLAASSLVLKASAGNAYEISMSDSTTADYLVLYNAAAAPASGASLTAASVLECIPVAASSYFSLYMPIPDYGSAGLVVLASTSCSTYTIPAVLPIYMNGKAK